LKTIVISSIEVIVIYWFNAPSGGT